MKEENTMRPFDPDEVEPEEAIREAREKERQAEEAHWAKLREERKPPERDPIRELGELLDKVDDGMQVEMEKVKRKCMGKCALFGGAAGIVLGAMAYGLANPMFALPLTAVYLMRAAVQYDRWAKI